jgi:hypothetical protein
MLGSLTAVSATVPSVKGLISVSDSLTASQFVMNLTSPSGTLALVGIPKKRAWLSVTGNGRTIWNQGTFTNNVPGITGAGEDSLYIKFNVNPGTWRFVALLTATGIQGGVQSAEYNETSVQFRRMVSFLNVSITTDEKFNVSVFDLSGKIVCRYVGRGGANVPVPNSILDGGARLIRVEVGGKSYVKKMVASNK